MIARPAFAFPLILSVVSLFPLCCGGEASPGPTSPDTGGSNQIANGGAATGGAHAGGGSAGAGGGGARSGTAGCAGTSVICVNGCVRESEHIEVRACQGGVRNCPDGFTLRSECPLDSCLRSTRSCCNPETGAVSQAECFEEKWNPCPEIAWELGPLYDCIPPRANVSDCSQLSGVCDSADLRCTSGGGANCGTLCACEADASGVLRWACHWVSCP